jgi:hypothetical protein
LRTYKRTFFFFHLVCPCGPEPLQKFIFKFLESKIYLAMLYTIFLCLMGLFEQNI